MAEVAVSGVLKILVKDLFSSKRLGDEIEEIKIVLQRLQAILRDADRRKEIDRVVNVWIEELVDIAYDIEDVIDKFTLLYQRRRGLIKVFCGFPEDCVTSRRTARRLHRIRKDLNEIYDRGQRYAPLAEMESSKGSSSFHESRQIGGSIVALNEIVGIERDTEILIGYLMDENPQRKVISVVGMGGLGKTTLVRNVYNHAAVQMSFEVRVWVSVSDSPGLGLLRSIVEALTVTRLDDAAHLELEQLRKMIYSLLQSKRYLIVLDDVWSRFPFYAVVDALPKNSLGSRLMFTTRNKDAATSLGGETLIHEVEPLNLENSWRFFCKRAFMDDACPSQLEEVARRIVRRCEGLPLAISVVGSLMSVKGRDSIIWQQVHDNLEWELSLSKYETFGRVVDILMLSFNDLPYFLKACFLYCAIFPEDQLIHRKRLIRLWVAEGFVQERNGEDAEDAAEGFLAELINRSMIQLVETNEFGRIRTCRVHDLMRDVALSKGKEENFSMVFTGSRIHQYKKIRRLSICKKGEYFHPSLGMNHLRSLFIFDEKVPSQLHGMFSSLKFLRVLELQSVPIDSVPGELTDLLHLRYLNLRSTNVRELPKSLGRLTNLQTLDIRNTRIEMLPKGLLKLTNLRHMFLYRIDDNNNSGFNYTRGIHVPNEICHLKKLRTLQVVEANFETVECVSTLKQLRKFSIYNLKAVDGEKLCHSITKMEHLRFLHIASISEEESLHLEALCRPPVHLQKMFLQGSLERVPQWFNSLSDLTCLWLHSSRLGEGSLSSLQVLPSLVALRLFKAYDGQELKFLAGSFQRLKRLDLDSLALLNSIRIEEGAMPSIQKINLLYCSQLKMIPEGIQYLTGLQELSLSKMPKELVESLQNDKGDGFLKVHVLKIEI